MSNFENRGPDTEIVKTQSNLTDLQANFMLEDNDPALELCRANLKEEVDSIITLSNNKEGKLIESMWNIDLLPREKELQEKLACAPLFNQVSNYMESCTVA